MWIFFYHHRPDPETPLEETMAALDHIVRQGKALYIGISNYSADETKKAIRILRDLGTPLLIHQGRYSMLNRQPEEGLLDHLERDGVGFIAFSPLAQGLLTERYLEGIPQDSRAAKTTSSLFEAGRYYTWHVGKNPNSSQYGAGAQSDIGSDGPFLGISKSWRYIRSRGC